MIPVRITDAQPGPAPVVTLIIGICATVFLVELSHGNSVDGLIWHWGIVPARQMAYWKYAPWMVWRWALPLITAMFLHGGWLHLVGNMWFLWVFGPPLERRLGSLHFAVLYGAGGIFASLMHIWINPAQVTPMIGASGAIASVLGAFLVLGPLRPVLTVLLIVVFPVILELPAFLVLVFWFAEQLLAGTLSLSREAGSATNVAWWAHVGGFLAGSLLVRLMGTTSWNQPETEAEYVRESEMPSNKLPDEDLRPAGFSTPRIWRPIFMSHRPDSAGRTGRTVILRDRWGRPVARIHLPSGPPHHK